MTTSHGRHVPDEVSQARARRNGGNKPAAVTTPEQWQKSIPDVLSRLKVTLAEMCVDDPENAGEGE